MTAYELAEQAEGLAYEVPADWSSGEPKNLATDIADMLRQQADRIAELEKQTKPLSDEEIKAIENSVKYSELALSNDEYMLKFAREIEERHGIK